MRVIPLVLVALGAAAALTLMFRGGGSAHGQRSVTVLAASSLRAPLDELADRFSIEQDIDLRVDYLPSDRIQARVEAGAPADLIAVADSLHAVQLHRQRLVETPRTFAANALVLALAPGNPAQIDDFGDLTGELKLGIGAKEVPVGRYARRLLIRLAQRYESAYAQVVLSNVVTEATSARDLVWPLRKGEVDAALVYRSDALAAGEDIEIIEAPEGMGPRVAYQAAVVTASGLVAAREFAGMLSGGRAAPVLAAHGFSFRPSETLAASR